MLPVIIIVVFAAITVWGVRRGRKHPHSDEMLPDIAAFFAGAGIPAVVIAWGCIYFGALSENGPIVVAHRNAMIARQTALSMNTVATTVGPNGERLVSWGQFGQSQATSAALARYRDMLIAFNNLIATRRVMQANWMIRHCYPPLPVDTKLFDLELGRMMVVDGGHFTHDAVRGDTVKGVTGGQQ